jgi:signal transduction histidine kinase/tetratricopeptide (TPR) repeat protein
MTAMVQRDPPHRLGGWRLERRWGAGAFGAVWLAQDELGQPAVVKLLPSAPGAEIRALSRVVHPCVVRPLGAGGIPVPYVAMELAPGRAVADGAVAEDDALRVVACVADGLSACHRAGVSHGDVKPANVMFDAGSGRVTLVDFGLADSMGGTREYAAPERLSGGRASPEADVFALGVMAGVLLPEPSRSWVVELRGQMMSPDPARRPTAREVADVFEAHGVALPVPTVEEVRRRAVAARVPRPHVIQAVERWLDRGGALAVVGPTGSGRTHTLHQAGVELLARGRPFVVLRPSSMPWAAVEAALRDPGLPGLSLDLPVAADPITRAEAAADALVTRAETTGDDHTRSSPATVLVDDWADLDVGTKATVSALLRLGVRLLIASDAPLAECPESIHLPPLTPAETEALLAAVLGVVDPVLSRGLAGQLPGRVLTVVDRAVATGALRWRNGTWVADTDRLAELVEEPGEPLDPGLLTDLERRAGAVVALAEPVALRDVLRWSEVDEGAVRSLADQGWIRIDHTLTCRSPLAARALAREVPAAVYRRLLTDWLDRPNPPWARLGPVIAGAGDQEAARRSGAQCVRAMAELDARQAADLGEQLLGPFARRPSPLVAATMTAMVRCGRLADARALGCRHLADRPPEVDDGDVLLQLASVAEYASEAPEVMSGWVDRAAALHAPGDEAPAVALARARALWRGRRLTEAEASCARLDEAWGEGAPAARRLQLRGLWAQVRADADDPRGGLQLLAALPDDLGAGTAERATVDGIRGRLYWLVGAPRDAARAFETAAEARRVLSAPERARLDNNAGLAWYSAGDVERAVSMWERALLGFEQIGAVVEGARAHINLCQGYRELGRWQRAEEAGQRAVDGARTAGAGPMIAAALGNLGDVAFAQRQLGLAEARWSEAEVEARRHGLAGELLELARRRAELAWVRRAPELAQRVEEALALAREQGAAAEEARCLALRAATAGLAGDGAAIRRDATAALELGKTLGSTGEMALVHLWLAEAWAAVGAAEGTEQAVAAQRIAEEFGRKPLLVWSDRIVAALRPAPDSAWRHLERLTDLALRVSRHTAQPELLQELAAAAVDLVGADRALVVLTAGSDVEIAARAARPGFDDRAPPAMSIVRRAISTRREVVVTDLDERRDLNEAASVMALDLHAVYCMPLLIDDHEVAGVLYLDSRSTQAALPETTVLLRALAAHGAVAVQNARLHSEMAEHTRALREIAHDLRSPLTGILLVTSLGEPLTEQDTKLGSGSADHALRLVEQTLGAVPEAPEVFELGRALQDWGVALAPQARSARVRLVVQVDTRRPVRARRAELRRVFTNLVGNALRFAPPNSAVEVRVFSEGGRIGFSVRDQGGGFDPGQLDQVFDSGFRGHPGGSGAGLGLSIVRQIATRHHGEAVASNHPEGGGVVTVWLPATRTSSLPPA